MAAKLETLKIKQGTDFKIKLQIRDVVTKAGVNITSYTFVAKIRSSPESVTIVTTFDTEILNQSVAANLGWFFLHLPVAKTLLLTNNVGSNGKYVMDVLMTDSSGKKDILAEADILSSLMISR